MTMKRWDGAAYQDVTISRRWDGASWIDLTIAKRWDGAAYQDVTLSGGGSLSLTLSTGYILGREFDIEPSPPAATVVTGAVVGTATGGIGAGPTYLWSRKSGSSAIVADSPTSASTTFSANVPKNTTRSAVFTLTVTRGVETKTADVTVDLEYYTEI